MEMRHIWNLRSRNVIYTCSVLEYGLMDFDGSVVMFKICQDTQKLKHRECTKEVLCAALNDRLSACAVLKVWYG